MEAAPGIDPHLHLALRDQVRQGEGQGLGLVGLVHQFQGGLDRRRRLGPGLRRLGAGHALPAGSALGRLQVVGALDQLLDGLAVGDVADEQAKLLEVGDLGGDGLEPGQEKVADGKVGAHAVGQKVDDFWRQLAGAIVDDVVGHATTSSFNSPIGLPLPSRSDL